MGGWVQSSAYIIYEWSLDDRWRTVEARKRWLSAKNSPPWRHSLIDGFASGKPDSSSKKLIFFTYLAIFYRNPSLGRVMVLKYIVLSKWFTIKANFNVKFLNSCMYSICHKGGLISGGFSLWLKSTKKGAKSLSY